MAAPSRRKGRRFELEVADALRSVYPDARPRLARTGGGRRDEPSVDGTPWWIVAARACVDPQAAQWQACRDMDGRPVAVVTKPRRGVPVVLVNVADLVPCRVPVPPVTLPLAAWIVFLRSRV